MTTPSKYHNTMMRIILEASSPLLSLPTDCFHLQHLRRWRCGSLQVYLVRVRQESDAFYCRTPYHVSQATFQATAQDMSTSPGLGDAEPRRLKVHLDKHFDSKHSPDSKDQGMVEFQPKPEKV